jgi:hypothetical protein
MGPIAGRIVRWLGMLLLVAGTPEQVARGAYLSHHVVGCTDCHGERDWTRYSAPQMPSREGTAG